MEIISDTTDTNGKRHIVARYTAEEKSAMAERASAHKEEMEKRRAEMEAAHNAKGGK